MPTTRREFLATSAIAAAGVAGGHATKTVANAPHTPLAVRTSPPVQKEFAAGKLLTTRVLQTTTKRSDWRTVKAGLVEEFKDSAYAGDPLPNWLHTFDNSFDEIASRAVCEAGQNIYVGVPGPTAKLAYEAQLFDSLLRSASSLLDRCLAYRREMGQFEIAGVKAGLDYISFFKMNPITAELDELSITDVRAAASSKAQAAAAAAFVKDHEHDHINVGLSVQAQGLSDDNAALASSEKERRDALKRKRDLAIDAQLAFFSRYVSPGSAYNYAERYSRLSSLMSEDLAEAYQKLFCAACGLKSVLNWTTISSAGIANTSVDVLIPLFTDDPATQQTLPAWIKTLFPTEVTAAARSPDILDALVLWTRIAMRQIEQQSQYEIEQTVSIPLNQGWELPNADPLPSATLTSALSAAGDVVLRFTIKQDILPFSVQLNAIRLQGVGLTIVHDDTDFANAPVPLSITARHVRLFATVNLPQQTGVNGQKYVRPPVLLSNVRVQGGNGGEYEPDLVSDPSVRNVYPFDSEWEIHISRRTLRGYAVDSVAAFPKLDFVKGLILHLRLRGTPA